MWEDGWHEAAMGQHLRMLHVFSGKVLHQLAALHGQDGIAVRTNKIALGDLRCGSDRLQNLFSAFYPRLTHLSLACTRFGSVEAPLAIGEGMPALRCLQLTASQDMHVSFSKTAQLQVLDVSCVAGPTSVMSLQFADVTAFAAKLTALSVAHRRPHSRGLSRLLIALLERGLLPLSMEQGGHLTHFWPQDSSAALAMRNALWTGAPPDPDTGWSPYACQCQACTWCLRRAGALTAL